ncbi:carboxypeptidase-like regulatory domain-containing protein [uncultured Psychroserpens sp.]|uniref:carboxypeptidase-like regulatory domain-containing protein n=1 Tax=uncultured Psychroserpens sp. TaxID=255436 RepID=UPI00260D039C|nr:carboxypeptidase-like regulatory domain-containing protein [uncultured Psychroserpens sp.]
MKSKTLGFFCSFLLTSLLYAQTLSGTVIDFKTKQPLMAVSVYFDNTTIGTTTDDLGRFSIDYSDAIQSQLIVSYLGYETIIVSDYRQKTELSIALKESLNQLDEVVVNTNDGLTRKQKLKLFRKEFLGFSEFSKSCKILNEDDLILRFNKADNVLSVSARKPVLVKNKSLQYEIAYDIQDFEITFRYVDAKQDQFGIHSVLYTGTSFYKDLNSGKKKALKHRKKAYEGSIQHFMRSLYHMNLKDAGFDIFHKKFKVNEWEFFKVEDINDSASKKVTFETKVNILFKGKDQSVLTPLVSQFYIDEYGNYTPIPGLLFSGVMGDQRIGDLLPTNYGLKQD